MCIRQEASRPVHHPSIYLLTDAHLPMGVWIGVQVDGFQPPILQEVKILPQEPSTTAPLPPPVSQRPIGGGAAREEGVGERTPILQGATIVAPKVGKKGGRGRGK